LIDMREDKGGVNIKVKVQPRSSRNQLAGIMDGAVKIKLTAPPVDGAANEACLKFLASLLKVPRTSLGLLSGQNGRNKTVRVEGVTALEVKDRLGLGDKLIGQGSGTGDRGSGG